MALFILLANTGFLVHKFNTAPCSSTGGTENSWSGGDLNEVDSRDIFEKRAMNRSDFKKGFLSFFKAQGSAQSLSQWCIEMAENSVPLRDKCCK